MLVFVASVIIKLTFFIFFIHEPMESISVCAKALMISLFKTISGAPKVFLSAGMLTGPTGH